MQVSPYLSFKGDCELADGGTVVMPLEQTFWAARFGVHCEDAAKS